MGSFSRGEIDIEIKPDKYIIFAKHGEQEFREEIDLPPDVDIEKTVENLRNGILEITLPKKRIDIKLKERKRELKFFGTKKIEMKIKPIILVVDDEENVSKFFHRILKKKEYTVLTANNGKAAIELVNTKGPDLVILDLKMPGMNGIETLRRIKKIDENMEVIMITGYETMKTAKMAMRLGAYHYITKPFDVNYIKALIRDAFSPPSVSLIQEVREIVGFRKRTWK